MVVGGSEGCYDQFICTLYGLKSVTVLEVESEHFIARAVVCWANSSMYHKEERYDRKDSRHFPKLNNVI